MALAVLDLDIDALPAALPASDHDGAVVLLRIDGLPAGQSIVALPLDAARGDMRTQLLDHADSAFWEAYLRRGVGLDPAGERPSSLPDATVVICTRDRTEDLERCLDGLMAMTHRAPILVVDNAPSTEDTRHLVARYPEVTYLREPKPGLDNARNTALAAVETPIAAFIDDDAAPDRHWLAMLLRNFVDPSVMAATGLTMALELDSDAQIAFQKVGGFTRGFKPTIHDAASCDPFKAWHCGAGVNMALRRAVVDLVGPFDPALDAGTRALAGGDTDLFRRILQAGYRIAYDPRALNWHRHRRSMGELQQQIYGYEAAHFAVLTKALWFERDPSALVSFARWLRPQMIELFREHRRRRRLSLPFRTSLTQVRGAASGPGRYLAARKKAQHG